MAAEKNKEDAGVALSLSLSCFLLAILVFYKGYQRATCLEYLLLAVLYLFQFNLSFSIFLSMKVLLSFFTFLFELIYTQMIENDAYHYSTGTPTSEAVDRSYNLNPSKHDLATDQPRSRMFYAPCVGFSISFTDNVLQERLQTCGKCQDWATVAIYLFSHILGIPMFLLRFWSMISWFIS
jgi:hypothetical protein